MRINKYFILVSNSYSGSSPEDVDTSWSCGTKVTQKEYDSVVIIHYPHLKDEFYPIVLREDKVASASIWPIQNFYKGVIRLLNIKEKKRHPTPSYVKYPQYYDYDRPKAPYSWGCREFSKKQLLLIKKTMEETYSKKQLGIK